MRGPTYLGTVESVTGSTVSIGLDQHTLSGLVYIEGQAHRVGQVGSFVRVPQGSTSLYAIVVQAGVAAAPTPDLAGNSGGRRWLTLELVGEVQAGKTFSRGIYRFPTIGDEAHLVTESDLAIVYGSADSREHIEFGHLSGSRNIPARLDVNKLVSRHSAVVGATGSGKSTTVAGLLHTLSSPEAFPAARILLLDLHGEYSRAFGDRSRIYRSQADESRGEIPLRIPYWALTLEELLPLTLGELDDLSQGRVVDWITKEKRAVADQQGTFSLPVDLVTVDTPLPFSLRKMWYDFRREIDSTYPRGEKQTIENAAELDAGDPDMLRAAEFSPNDGTNIVASRSTLGIRRQLEALSTRLQDPRLSFLFDPGPWSPSTDSPCERDLDDLLAGWLGHAPSDSRPITTLDLSGVPADLLSQLVGALLRLIFDAMFWGRNLAEGGRHRPLLIVMEEAHIYLGDKQSTGANAVRRIVKEGRKYGISAMIVSQRPTEIDETILSQCGTFLALRMGNQQDRSRVAGATTESLRSLLDLLPTLRTGEALVVGEATHLPTRAMIHRPPSSHRPSSEDPRVVEKEYAAGEPGPGGWDRQLEPTDYSDLVHAWRHQNPRSRRIVEEGDS